MKIIIIVTTLLLATTISADLLKGFEKGIKTLNKEIQPIEEKINEATDNRIKKAADVVSETVTGEKWKEGLANDLRTVVVTASGNAIGGKVVGTVLGNAADSIKNEPTEDRK